ncbi:hypothetical protein [Ulvibacter litoralis]|uniref:RND transporter n=1 Tax=Ulvibacter litoralis TaxID=227084 RepID=A0A1G7HKR5_9FLAO|nr:hypothetical protein [Ulvibacter litoralis]GHC58214.1 hypothetical protein GCM10008083_23630 [Ulvibacter litoralis]SDF01035.1 hypothetical protein SAMN05421855_104152 [Ulvibacter litoralis]
MKLINNWQIIGIACLTLGLAPFFPEPHVWGKLKWVLGGGHGMEFKDWFDFLFHGAPFVLLIRIVILKIISFTKNT